MAGLWHNFSGLTSVRFTAELICRGYHVSKHSIWNGRYILSISNYAVNGRKMIKLITENPQIKSTVETVVVASAAANGFDLAGFIDLTLNPILQAVSLIAGISLSVIMIYQRIKNKGQNNA
jgi:hypothetical protein